MRRALGRGEAGTDSIQALDTPVGHSKLPMASLRSYFGLPALMALYVLTGMLQPALIDTIKYTGGLGSIFAVLPMLANVGGMAAVGLCRRPGVSWSDLTRNERNRVGLLALVDASSGVCLITGLVTVGGGVFTVVYSSCTVFTAVLSRIALSKRLARLQWLGVCGITIGLALNCAGPASKHTPSGLPVPLGVCLTLAGSLLHSAVFILTESALGDGTGAPAEGRPRPQLLPWQLCTLMGRAEASALLLWNLAGYSLHREGWVQLSLPSFALFSALWLVNTLHAAAFFDLIGSVGAVSSAVLKGVQSVSVYAFSALVFCKYQESQCFTWTKAVSLVIVLAGTCCYSLSSSPAPSPPPPTSEGTAPALFTADDDNGLEEEDEKRQPESTELLRKRSPLSADERC